MVFVMPKNSVRGEPPLLLPYFFTSCKKNQFAESEKKYMYLVVVIISMRWTHHLTRFSVFQASSWSKISSRFLLSPCQMVKRHAKPFRNWKPFSWWSGIRFCHANAKQNWTTHCLGKNLGIISRRVKGLQMFQTLELDHITSCRHA